MKVSVIGQGYVGLPLALSAAYYGKYEVVGVDINPKIVGALNEGDSHVEDIEPGFLKLAIESLRYRAENDFDSITYADVIVICVPTPLTSSGNPDLSHLEFATRSVAPKLKSGSLVIIESTVSPGTTRNFVGKILSENGGRFELAYSPERIDPANQVWNITNTPKLVGGITEKAKDLALKFYNSFIEVVIPASSVEVVETAKLLENSFRLINISFINEMAEFCWKLGIDVREVISAAATKPYGFMPFHPGPGVGGHCIPVDPVYLSWKAKEVGASSKFIDLAVSVNKNLPFFFIEIARKKLGTIQNKNIILIGVAYKPNIADVRETAALDILLEFRLAGANVFWHDNLVKNWNNEMSSSLTNKYDLAILVNPHSSTDLTLLGTTPILDTRGGY